jgi:hypothetical protein
MEGIIQIDTFYLTVNQGGFGECGVHTQNKKNSKVDLCFAFFNHFFLGSESRGITHQLTGGFYESQALRPYGRVIDGMYASSGTRDR